MSSNKKSPKPPKVSSRPSQISPSFNRWQELANANSEGRSFRWTENNFLHIPRNISDEAEVIKRMIDSGVSLTPNLKEYISKQSEKRNPYYKSIITKEYVAKAQGNPTSNPPAVLQKSNSGKKSKKSIKLLSKVKSREEESEEEDIFTPKKAIFTSPMTPLQTAVKVAEVVKLNALIAEEEEDEIGIASGLGNLTDTKAVSKTPGLVEPAKTVSFYGPKKVKAELEEDILAPSSFTFPTTPGFTAPIVPKTPGLVEPAKTVEIEKDLIKSKLPELPLPASTGTTFSNYPGFYDPIKPSPTERGPVSNTTSTYPGFYDPTTPSQNEDKQPDPENENTPDEPIFSQASDTQVASIVPKDKNAPRYHKDVILLFFGSSTSPPWDLELVASVNQLKWTKKQVNDAIDAIIDRHSENYLIFMRKSNGDIQEFLEVIQIHFCFQRNLQRGSRTASANIPVSSLVAFSNKLNGISSVPSSSTSDLLDYVPTSKTDAALASVVNITENESRSKIIEAFDARKTDFYGKPLANDAVVAMTLVKPDGNLIGLNSPKDPLGSVPKPLSFLNIKTRAKGPCRKY